MRTIEKQINGILGTWTNKPVNLELKDDANPV